MLGFVEDICASHSALCFYIQHKPSITEFFMRFSHTRSGSARDSWNLNPVPRATTVCMVAFSSSTSRTNFGFGQVLQQYSPEMRFEISWSHWAGVSHDLMIEKMRAKRNGLLCCLQNPCLYWTTLWMPCISNSEQLSDFIIQDLIET